jgi:hypothetical protein
MFQRNSQGAMPNGIAHDRNSVVVLIMKCWGGRRSSLRFACVVDPVLDALTRGTPFGLAHVTLAIPEAHAVLHATSAAAGCARSVLARAPRPTDTGAWRQRT